MTSSKTNRILFFLLVMLFSFDAFTQNHAATLRIGFQKYGTLLLLKSQGSLERRLSDRGIRVQWVEFPGGPQLLEGLNVGAIDFGVTGETPPIFAQAAGADLLYAAYEPPSPESEAILVPSDSSIRSVVDLRGKRIALNKGSNVHYLLVRALEQAGLRYSDVRPVYLTPSDARAAFENRRVDAWVVWDPFLAAAQRQLAVRTLIDGRTRVDNHQFYLVSKAYARAHPQLVRLLVDEIRSTGDWIRRHPDQASALVAPVLGLPLDVTATALRRQQTGARLADIEILRKQQAIADAFTGLGLIPRHLEVDESLLFR